MATLPQPPSFDAHLACLRVESFPLFMSALPEDPVNNIALGALQSLVHDGTPTVGACLPIHGSSCAHTDHKEAAQNFEEQGKKYFRGKQYSEALGFPQGAAAQPNDARWRGAPGPRAVVHAVVWEEAS
jgi:hypothetical protein